MPPWRERRWGGALRSGVGVGGVINAAKVVAVVLTESLDGELIIHKLLEKCLLRCK